jgi:hypothetical protein
MERPAMTRLPSPWEALTRGLDTLPEATAPSTTRVCIDDPIFWRLFLRRLSFDDAVFDAMTIASLCETLHVPAERVLAKMKATMFFAYPSTAAH